ncbi:MAG TPA: cyclic nucleotide-binding domain-containing protein [Kofleriaceae bacterium]
MNRRAFMLGAAMVLLGSLVAIALRAFAEAAFLGTYGAKQMPWLLIANAGGFAVATLGYDAITRVARAAIVDLALLVLLAVAAAIAPTLLAHGAPPVVLVVALAAASQVAGLALWNRVCAAVAGRDARRYLPRAGAAVTAGASIAGLGAGVVIPRLGLSAVPYLGAGVTLIVLVVCVAQERALVTGGAPGGAPGGPGMPRVKASTDAPAQVALTSVQQRLISAMLAVAALEAIVGTAIDLQFLGTLRARYTGDDLAVAIALFYGGTNGLLFLLQSAAVPRLLVTRAMTFTAAIHPLLVILSYAGFAAAPGFIGIAGTRTADQVLRFATSRTSQELELSALPPAPRGRWKVLLRGAVWPAATAAAAFVLLVVGPAALHGPAALAGVAIAVAVVWAIWARVAARRFQTALAAPLGIRRTAATEAHRIDLDTLERWTHAAGADDPMQAALARAALTRVRVDATDLAEHLRHDEPAVRAALFDQLARAPAPVLRGELRAAIGIEDDDRALALGIKALAIARDEAGVVRGKARIGLSREVDAACRSAELMLSASAGPTAATAIADEFGVLLERDPAWAAAFARARRSELSDAILDARLRLALANATARAGAFAVIARVGPASCRPLLADALEAGDSDALGAIEDIDREGAATLVGDLAQVSPLARAAIARALAAAPAGAELISVLVDDADPEVAYAALRSALGFARGGGELSAARINAAHAAALAALDAHLDARDAVAGSSATWSACARQELDIATRRCVARVLCAAAIEAAAAGRDPAPIAATARHLIGGGDADRKRALDVVQELQARPQLLAAIERWLRPAKPSTAVPALAAFDPWLARLGAGELAALEPLLVDLRRPALFASIAGPALAALADRASRRRVAGALFNEGDAGATMFVVSAGALAATRSSSDERRIGIGDVVGELAVLTHAPRAATLTAVDGDAEVIEIDRATFAAAARRAPELVLGLSATLAGWLAPNRPDVL